MGQPWHRSATDMHAKLSAGPKVSAVMLRNIVIPNKRYIQMNHQALA